MSVSFQSYQSCETVFPDIFESACLIYCDCAARSGGSGLARFRNEHNPSLERSNAPNRLRSHIPDLPIGIATEGKTWFKKRNVLLDVAAFYKQPERLIDLRKSLTAAGAIVKSYLDVSEMCCLSLVVTEPSPAKNQDSETAVAGSKESSQRISGPVQNIPPKAVVMNKVSVLT
jgi:hypothetical protein